MKKKQKKDVQPKNAQPNPVSTPDIIYDVPVFSIAHACVESMIDHEVSPLPIGQVFDVLVRVSQAGIFAEDETQRRVAQELAVAIVDEYADVFREQGIK